MTAVKEKFDKASAEYLRRLEYNNLSPCTLRNYRTVLNGFSSFLAEQDSDTEDLYDLVEQWRDGMLSGGSKPSTVRQKLTTLKIFFDKATRRSFPAALRYAENPVDEDFMPKNVKRPYEEILTDEQVIMLYQNTAPPRFSEKWARNYAMIQLCLNEKIRNAELLDLRLSDLDFAHHELTVESGKGRKFRIVDLTELTEQAITQYLDSGIRPAYLGDDDYLFGTNAPHEFSQNSAIADTEAWHRGTTNFLSLAIERTVKAVTGVDSVRSHDLRHVGARVCLNAGQSMEELQGQLGHSSITTTQIYADRLLQRRRRDSARAVLAARDEAAQKLKEQNERNAGQNIVPLFA